MHWAYQNAALLHVVYTVVCRVHFVSRRFAVGPRRHAHQSLDRVGAVPRVAPVDGQQRGNGQGEPEDEHQRELD